MYTGRSVCLLIIMLWGCAWTDPNAYVDLASSHLENTLTVDNELGKPVRIIEAFFSSKNKDLFQVVSFGKYSFPAGRSVKNLWAIDSSSAVAYDDINKENQYTVFLAFWILAEGFEPLLLTGLPKEHWQEAINDLNEYVDYLLPEIPDENDVRTTLMKPLQKGSVENIPFKMYGPIARYYTWANGEQRTGTIVYDYSDASSLFKEASIVKISTSLEITASQGKLVALFDVNEN